MPEGKNAQLEGAKCPSAALLPEVIFNYVLTVKEYVFALSEEKLPENWERAGKIVKEPGKVRETTQMISFFNNSLNISFFSHALSWKNMCERAKTYSSPFTPFYFVLNSIYGSLIKTTCHVRNCIKTCQREYVNKLTHLTCNLSCEHLVNSFFVILREVN